MRFSENIFQMVFIRKEIYLPSENELCQDIWNGPSDSASITKHSG